MTRLGKIARLPRDIREQLNIRLSNGEVGRELVEWLNHLPETQTVLAAYFGRRPINDQNLTEWKQGGYEDWLRQQEDCAHARILVENARDLEKEAGAIRLEERLAAPMALALARLIREFDQPNNELEKQKTLLNVARELTQLRHASYCAERVRLEREQWETKQSEAAEEKRVRQNAWEQAKAQYFAFNGFDPTNPAGLPPDELVTCLQASARHHRAEGNREDQMESNQFKPNQTNSNLPAKEGDALSSP